MKLHQIQPTNPLKKPKRVGRGGKRGTYSGSGMKGQKARSGAKLMPLFAGGAPTLTGKGSRVFHILRGYKNVPDTRSEFMVFNIDIIAKYFADKDVVSPETLIEKGLLKSNAKKIKILARGATGKKFLFQDVFCSREVQNKFSL